jgi:hypothetical protein
MSEGTDGFWDAIKDMGAAVVNEAIMPALEKAIPQGASELGQALFTGQGYMPYGPTERPMDVPEATQPEMEQMSLGDAMAKAAEAPAVEPLQIDQQQGMDGREM